MLLRVLVCSEFRWGVWGLLCVLLAAQGGLTWLVVRHDGLWHGLCGEQVYLNDNWDGLPKQRHYVAQSFQKDPDVVGAKKPTLF